MPFPVPDDESLRLESLWSLEILDTPAEDRFDRLTRLARKVFDVPFSMLTLVDRDRQWFKAAEGHTLIETPRIGSFCQYTILQEGLLIVEDASKDPRYFDLPVVFDMGIRFYAGVPIHGPEERRVGTFCILDNKARGFAPEDVIYLEDLARCAESELHLISQLKVECELLSEMDELRRKVSVDPVTRCWNEPVIRDLMGKLRTEGRADSQGGPAFLMIELAGLAEVNENFGAETGDRTIREAANRIRSGAPANTCLGRLRGSRLLLLFEYLQAKSAGTVCQRILSKLDAERVPQNPGLGPIEGYGGFVFHTPVESDESLLERASKALDRAKRESRPGSFMRAV